MKPTVIILGYIVAVVATNLGLDLPLRVAVVALISTFFAFGFVFSAAGSPVLAVAPQARA